MKYRKKPVEIEAMQWDGKNLFQCIVFMEKDADLSSRIVSEKFDRYTKAFHEEGLKIYTLEGIMNVSVGDYIIKGVQGEFYPCKPDIFAKTYEEV